MTTVVEAIQAVRASAADLQQALADLTAILGPATENAAKIAELEQKLADAVGQVDQRVTGINEALVSQISTIAADVQAVKAAVGDVSTL